MTHSRISKAISHFNISQEISCKKTVSEMSAKYFLSLVVLSSFFPDIFALSFGDGTIVGVIGGKPIAKGDWPWLVALVYSESGQHFCGGTLISAKHVLSGKVATWKNLIR